MRKTKVFSEIYQNSNDSPLSRNLLLLYKLAIWIACRTLHFQVRTFIPILYNLRIKIITFSDELYFQLRDLLLFN